MFPGTMLCSMFRSAFETTSSAVVCLVSLMGNYIVGLCLSPLTRMCLMSWAEAAPGFDVSVGVMKIFMAR